MGKVLSVIIPSYNEEKTIGGLLEAIFEQDYPKNKIEIIFI